jgi:hypothetical protein
MRNPAATMRNPILLSALLGSIPLAACGHSEPAKNPDAEASEHAAEHADKAADKAEDRADQAEHKADQAEEKANDANK